MKKVKFLVYILLTVTSLSLITSCMSDDSTFIVKAETGEISFVDPFTQKNTARTMGDINNSNLKQSNFKVWGAYAEPGSDAYTSVFNGTEIYSVNGLWIYDNPVKWEMDKEYKFAALAPTDVIAEDTYSYSNNGFKITGIPLSAEASESIDYLVSTLTETNYENSGSNGVQINFKHILSRLKISLKYSNEDSNLLKVTISELSIKLPKGTAKYEQVDPNGPSSEDIWTFPSDISNVTYTLISEDTVATSNYVSLGEGFFLAPMSADVNAKMDISYSIELMMGEEIKKIDVVKEDISLEQIDSLSQGCITNLMLNIKPTGSDYAYIEINADQQVADHEEDNGYIDEQGRAFTISALSQSGDKLIADINTLGNDPQAVRYYLKSVVDENGVEQLSSDSGFEYVTDKEDDVASFETGVNALLETDQTYTFTIQDHRGNEQKFSYTTTGRLGGASMIWTIQIPADSKSMALDIPIKDSGTLPFTVRVDWGDGTESLIVKGSALSKDDDFLHVYSETGEYKVTITSAVADYTKQQFLPFSFYKYRRGSSKTYNENDGDYNTYRLVSVDTPLLNMNSSNPENLFRGCKALTKVPKKLFIYNSMITKMNYTFCGTIISEIPSGLFDCLEDVKEFEGTFSSNSYLISIPRGLMAKQKSAYNFKLCFSSCKNLKLNSYIFINSEDEKETRFAELTQAVNFTQLFTFTSGEGTAPDLWNYTYPAGYTWENSSNKAPFHDLDNNSFTNYSEIPEKWITGHPDLSEGWVYPN